MTKRFLAVALAVAIFSSLSLSAPTYAGSTLVTTDVSFALKPTTATAGEIDVFYTPSPLSGGISGLSVVSTTLSGVVLTPVGGDEVKVTFAQADAGNLTFTFTTNESPSNVGLDYGVVKNTQNGPIKNYNLNIDVSAVPEPASMALLGVGMAGFLSFRRLLSRRRAAV